MSRALIRVSTACLLSFCLTHAAAFGERASEKAPAAKPGFDDALFKALKWREVGPFRGGRSAAVEGLASQPLTYYFGSTGGGVWKTTDGGESWKNMSDGTFGGSIGAVAVAPSDPNVVYVGGGEITVRGNVSHGDGMWKSTDGGVTWKRIGLEDSRQIGRIRVHPQDPNLVYVAVLGHAFGPSDQRGVYRSKDGGTTWQRVLFANRDAGAIDLVMDPSNPRILYASTWRFRRMPWGFESGGEGSALWKSTDGGDTWKNLTQNATKKSGLPKAPLGIIGVSISAANSQNLYAIIEAEEGGLFRSKDGGETWTKTSESRDLRQRAWYYSRVYADPKDEDTVYVVNVQFHKSKDGGKSFSTIRVPHGDNHDLWIAPNDSLRMIEANDGGANVTFDGGRTWTTEDNQPTAQFYRVSTDNDFPYHILGAQQDNSAVRIRSRSGNGGIGEGDWEVTAGGESGYILADPRDPDIVFGGSYGGLLTVVNHRTEEVRDVNPWPDNPMGWGAAELKYRFQWNFPMQFSPNDPSVLYAGANVVFRSKDRGASWEVISPDLTRDDKTKEVPAGGPITKDNTSVEYYATVFAIAESPVEPGVIWAGSDDGLVHVTRDNGKTWAKVTPTGVPEWAQINAIDASPLEKGVAYVAATRYKLDDLRPYLFRTRDYGATWTEIDRGIPADQFTRVVRADTKRQGLLFAGTERGVWMSFDDGAHWQSLQLKLPVVPIADLTIKNDDLIAATHGRAFWVLDDIGVLRELDKSVAAEPVHVYAPAASYRLQGGGGGHAPRNQGTNPATGVVLAYSLIGQKDATPLKLEFLDSAGKVLRTFKGETAKEDPTLEAKPAGEPPPQVAPIEGAGPAKVAANDKTMEQDKKDKDEKAKKAKNKPKEGEPTVDGLPGLNRFVWDLEVDKAKDFSGMILWAGGEGELDGPRVVPGKYKARLTVGEGDSAVVKTVPFEIKADPRSKVSPADLQAQYDFLLDVRDKLSEVNTEIRRIRQVRTEIGAVKTKLGDDEKGRPIVEAADALDKKMTAVEEALYQTKNKARQDPLNYPVRLNDKLALVGSSAGTGDYPPTAQALLVKKQLEAQIDEQLAKLKEVWDKDLPALNALVNAGEVPAISGELKDEESAAPAHRRRGGESDRGEEDGDEGTP
ncbi:MAG: glycosyl hydrolase [Acidobacteriota bacterium]